MLDEVEGGDGEHTLGFHVLEVPEGIATMAHVEALRGSG